MCKKIEIGIHYDATNIVAIELVEKTYTFWIELVFALVQIVRLKLVLQYVTGCM